MKTINRGGESSRRLNSVFTRAIIIAGFLLYAASGRAQSTPPILTVATMGTNLLAITITNGVSMTTYDIYTTPVLGDTVNFPWTAAVVGTNGQTNFTVTMLYPNSFYRAVVDTNGVPIWAAADPNNPGAGYLAVFIDTPVNGSNLTQ